MTENLLEQDLNHVLEHTREMWEEVRGNRIFITGGTGFFGCWLLESFAWANLRLGLDASLVVLTRNPESFRLKAPHLAENSAIGLLAGDIRSFQFPDGPFPFIIHAAAETSIQASREAPLELLDILVSGTRRVLDFARHCGTRKLLLTSSGAVYGRQPNFITHLSEDFHGAPDPTDPQAVYGEGKRLSELLCALYAEYSPLECKIARCFAFSGPYLPVDRHYAFSSFVRDAIQGGPVRVNGDGTPLRSYLYGADLAIWLWTILFRGKNCRPYNVGSEREVTIAELAEAACALRPGSTVEIARKCVPEQAPHRYVPSAVRARVDLGLEECVDWKEAILRTARWQSVKPVTGAL